MTSLAISESKVVQTCHGLHVQLVVGAVINGAGHVAKNVFYHEKMIVAQLSHGTTNIAHVNEHQVLLCMDDHSPPTMLKYYVMLTGKQVLYFLSFKSMPIGTLQVL